MTKNRSSTTTLSLSNMMLRGTVFAVFILWCLLTKHTAFCFSAISINQKRTINGGHISSFTSFSSSSSSLPLAHTRTETTSLSAIKGPRRVAVAGATGRVGRLVVNELLTSYTAGGTTAGTTDVIALVRSKDKAAEIFPVSNRPSNLAVVVCDLSDEQQVLKALNGCQAVIWCASGASASNVAAAATGVDQSIIDKLKNLMGMNRPMKEPSKSIDTTVFPILAKALPEPQVVNGGEETGDQVLPQIVMCSACAVTRPTWSAEKKKKFAGAADIPIVRLNPLGILDLKRQSEDILRQQSGTPYCIVRSVGLRDDWPTNSRPIFSQGDVAAGRINPEDLARILVQALVTPAATGKTFEVATIQGYPPGAADAMSSTLSKLHRDDEGDEFLSMDHVAATYSIMQQLLPGETQDTTALVMGQSYEELDAEQSSQKKKEAVGAM